jgi:phosphatidylserine/phosphatidylglycerophosphate/cardiolipin synthase-like enzyme
MHYARTFLLSLALLPACQCHREHHEVEPATLGVSLFAPDFRFTCSPNPEIGCAGVFDVRTGAELRAVPTSGLDALGVRIQSLHAAKRSIRIQALIFRADETGLHLAELLRQRKAEGIDVRVIVDAMSNLDWQTQWMYFDLKRAGIEVEGYEALYLEWLTAEKLLDPLHANKRFHDKLWIIDGEDPEHALAIVGGLNLANEYFRVDDEPINRWHDQDIVLRGPIVDDVMTAFDRNYDFFKGIKHRLPEILNPDNAWKTTAAVREKIAAVTLPTWLREDLRAAVRACASRPVEATYRPQSLRFLHSRPRHDEAYILQAYLAQIETAQRSILVANAYFIPSGQIAAALQRAVDRGVEVVVLTNSPESNDIAEVATMSRHLYRTVMREQGGVAIHEWVGPAAGEGTLHAKLALFDDTSAIIGSYNLDPRSERLNSETAIAVQDPALVGAMAKEFRESLLPKSRKIDWAEATAYHQPADLPKKLELLYAMPMKDWL